MATNFEIKQESFCRFTKLRQTNKTADFMVMLMDVYERSLQSPTGYDMVDGFTTDAPITDATSTGVKMKRTRRPNVNKDTK
jgi:hypothetical protein